MAKYAPADESGRKPYVVEYSNWGKVHQSLIYAKDAADAKYGTIGRSRPGVYARSARRATPDDVAAMTPLNYN